MDEDKLKKKYKRRDKKKEKKMRVDGYSVRFLEKIIYKAE